SPVLHFWSLGVEEQLYAVWPLLLLAAWTWFGRRRPRAALLGAVLLVGVPSFVLGAVLVAQGDPSAYFVTTTRVWEFGAGALVGLALLRGRGRGGPALRLAAAYTGWVLLAAYMVLFRVELGFPGVNAVVPVAATALVIWAGDPRGPLSRALRARPVQLVGATSYSVYLWHWPVLVLLPYALTAWGIADEPRRLDLGWWEVLLLALAVIGLAWVTLRLVEDPVRFSPRAQSPRRVLAAALAATLALAAAVTAAGAATARGLDEKRLAGKAAEDALVQRVAPRTAPSPGAPTPAPVWDADTCRGPSALVESACSGFTWPDVIPAVGVEEETAADVVPIDTTPGTRSCLGYGGDFDVHDCVYGTAGGTKVALVGDSHAFHWLPAFAAVARQHNLELHLFARSGCPLSETPRDAPQEQVDGCLSWSHGVHDALLGGGFSTVVVSSFAGLQFQDPSPADGFRAAWAPLVDAGIEVVVVRDTPSLGQGRWACAQTHPDDVNTCSRPQADALANDDGRLVAAKALGLRVLDLTRYFCAEGVCPVAIGGVRVYRDANHMTGTYSLLLAPYLSRELLPLD
ncbi:MAG: acyltransferase family protein, partial [Candidatus Nanopelagicales bacterium]